jgi:hypothetical protein
MQVRQMGRTEKGGQVETGPSERVNARNDPSATARCPFGTWLYSGIRRATGAQGFRGLAKPTLMTVSGD